MSATLLAKKADNAEATRRLAGNISRASGRMERLIEQVLNFALARVKGGIPVQLTDADLGKVARQVISELDADAAVRLRTEIVGDTNGRWDPDRMMQVLSNLIGNALEHGEPQTPILVRLDGAEDNAVRLEIHNRGVIPRLALEMLFSPFKPRQHQSHGIGLGLYIVDQIIRAHGGEVQVRSGEHEGTTFQICLPRHPNVETA